jgi:hypothetical protein
MTKQTVSKSELAALLGCSKSSVTYQIGRGMPVKKDGTLDRRRCLEWLSGMTSGHPGGWSGDLRGDGLQARAERLLAGKPALSAAPEPAPASDELLDAIRQRAAVLLPEVARRLGLPEHIVACAHEVLDLVLAYCHADANFFNADEEGYGYEWPAYDPPGHKASRKVEAAADAFIEKLHAILSAMRQEGAC